MSDLLKELKPSNSKDCPAFSVKPIHQKLSPCKAKLGDGLVISRLLPNKLRRMVGAWCFFDHFGPLDLKKASLDIRPHPHIGLQTFTWPIAGEILHRDSLGTEQIIRPGEINLMTAGRGIAHSEESLADTCLHGVQLWIALPDSVRLMKPEFAHYDNLPIWEQGGFSLTLLVGELFDQQAPTRVFSPLIGLDLNALAEAIMVLPLNPHFEYGILVLKGEATIEGGLLEPDSFLYLGCGREQLPIRAPKGARIMLIGGEPFAEEIIMWWNFVARSREELVKAAEDWNNHCGFGEVTSYPGERLMAPAVPWIK